MLPEVTHTIEHLFLYYGDDAGWSPEALGQAAPDPNSDGAASTTTTTAGPAEAPEA
jgi:hypothetical protein